jgi:hypothetical protein
MRSQILKARIRQDIQAKVERVLRELGYPEPPLRLEDVRGLLRLECSYFAAESDGLLKETFSKLRRAGKQVLRRPTILGVAIRKFGLRALYLPEGRRILIDESIPKPKHRWLEAHEIGHDLLPWHHEMLLGDDEVTPTAATHDKMEAEANFAAGSLLFLNEKFARECRDLPASIASAQKLRKRYGNTFTTTLWRMIEHAGEDRPIIGLVGRHPRDFDNDEPTFRHFVPSAAFHRAFNIPGVDLLTREVRAYCQGKRGPIGRGEVIIAAKDGKRHVFQFETFYNGYDALTLGVHVREVPAMISAGWGKG